MKALLATVALLVFASGCLQLLAARQEENEKKAGPRIDVSVDSDENVKGADVWLDNEVKGKAPLVLQTTSGRHLVEVKKSGFSTFSQWVTVKTDQETIIVVPSLARGGGGPPGATGAPGATGVSGVSGGPGAQVAVAAAPPNTWTYDVTSTDAAPFRRVVWEGGMETFDGRPAFFIDSVVVSRNGAARMQERDFFVRGPDGLEYLGTRSDFEATDSASHTHSVTDTNLASPQLALRVPFQVNTKWPVQNQRQVVTKTTISTTKKSESSARATSTVTGEYAVTGIEQVTVPAGVFDCLVVRGTATTKTEHNEGSRSGTVESVTTVTVSWYAPKVGLVKSETTADVEVRAKGATTTKRWTSKTQLKEYRVVGASLEMEAVGFVSELPKAVAPPPVPVSSPSPPAPPGSPPVN